MGFGGVTGLWQDPEVGDLMTWCSWQKTQLEGVLAIKGFPQQTGCQAHMRARVR